MEEHVALLNVNGENKISILEESPDLLSTDINLDKHRSKNLSEEII